MFEEIVSGGAPSPSGLLTLLLLEVRRDSLTKMVNAKFPPSRWMNSGKPHQLHRPSTLNRPGS